MSSTSYFNNSLVSCEAKKRRKLARLFEVCACVCLCLWLSLSLSLYVCERDRQRER